jgi:hypothetical protein
MQRNTGGCLCGAVRYEVRGKLRGVVYCHCSQCRRQTGHCVAATEVDDDCLSVAGAERVRWFEASPTARRGFCGTCGSVLFWKGLKSPTTAIMAGGFDLPSGLEAVGHIFVADKGDYYEIADGLPQSPGGGES